MHHHPFFARTSTNRVSVGSQRMSRNEADREDEKLSKAGTHQAEEDKQKSQGPAQEGEASRTERGSWT